MPDYCKLTIHFQGICVHFRGVVPGVPHRVVLPRADQVRQGKVKVGVELQDYTICPHFRSLHAKEGQTFVNVLHLIDGGTMLAGGRLQIVNAINPLTYHDDFKFVMPLTRYVPTYRPSSDVVFAGRAAGYFDIFNGDVGIESVGEAVHTKIEMITNGKPILQITPLVADPGATTPVVQTLTLETEELRVGNFSNSCDDSRSFDFLLNYLTADTGLPLEVTADFPLANAASIIETGSMSIRDAFLPPTVVVPKPLLLPDIGTSLSCSDARYP